MLIPLLVLCCAQAAPAEPKFGAFVEELRVQGDLEWIAYGPDGRPWVPSTGVADVFVRAAVFARDGRRFSTAIGDHRVRVDAAGGSASVFGGRGREAGQLLAPSGLALDVRDAGRMLVADTLNHRVCVFTLDGAALSAFGRLGAGDGELNHPLDVACDASGAVFVADAGNDRVVKFDADGRFVKSFGGRGSYPGLFRHPTGLDVHGERVYVADRDNHRIEVFDLDGRFVYEWGVNALLPREGGGKLHDPSDVAVSPDGTRVAVLEPREDRIQVFGLAREDTELTSSETDSGAHFGGHPSVRRDLFAVADPSGPFVSIFDLTTGTPIEITKFGRPGEGSGRMRRPVSVLLDERAEHVLVADPYAYTLSSYRITRKSDEVLRFDPFLARLERTCDLRAGSAVSLQWPIEPAGMALGTNGEIYLADRANQRVVVLDRDLVALRSIDAGILYPPCGVALTGNDSVLLVAGSGRSIEKQPDEEAAAQLLTKADGMLAFWNATAKDPLHVYCGPQASGIAVRWGALWTIEDHRGLVVRHNVFPENRNFPGYQTLGGTGIGRCEFWKPEGLAVDEGGRLFVVDAGNHRFQILDAEGHYLDMFGARFYTEAARNPPPQRPAPNAWDDAKMVRTLDESWRIAWKPRAGPIRRGEPFAIDAWVFEPGFPGTPARDVELRLDAWMPDHLHGMNRVPKIARREDHGFTVEGMLLHMAGFWELDLDVTRAGVTSRATLRLDLE